MARFAPVAPPEFIKAIRNACGADFGVGRYHLLLAHDVVRRQRDYIRLFPTGSVIIMDNSMIELGEPVDGEIMEQACSIVGPQIVVLPDYAHDSERTVQVAREWAHDRESSVSPNSQQHYMAVPQGNTLEEYMECARRLAEIPRVLYWGIPRSATDKLGTRKDLVKRINLEVANHVKTIRSWTCIHLLGISTDFYDDLVCAQQEGVMGIDSAAPLRLGQQGRLMTPKFCEPGPRGDWWDNPFIESNTINPAVLANLYLIRGWIG